MSIEESEELSEIELEYGTIWPMWVPLQEQCMWCNAFALDPEEVDLYEDKVVIHYYCSNKDCKHVEQKGKPAYYGLEFHGESFVKKYEEFTEEMEELERLEDEDGSL